MEPIQFECFEPSSDDPRKLIYKGQRSAREVFEELRYRLDSTGNLPDEYFELDSYWEDGREIPEDADLYCTTDYGGNEGIYIDVYLKWYEENKPITKGFITGKTLGETGGDLDRMYLISSAITKAFHGDHGTYARYVRFGEPEDCGDSILYLSGQERRTLIDSLVETRNGLTEETLGVEKLLRRVTGSITEYVNEVGQRPLLISDYDQAVLAIRDGNLGAFKELFPKAADKTDDLLLHAAGRPGTIGRKMTQLLLADKKEIPQNLYLSACNKAVDTGDTDRVSFMLKQAAQLVPDLHPSFHGEVISYAYHNNRRMASKLLEQSTPEQIQAAPSKLLYETAMEGDFPTAMILAQHHIDATLHAAGIVRAFAAKRNGWMLEQLLKSGLRIDSGCYTALHACIATDLIEAARLLLDRGMDFDGYQVWKKDYYQESGHEETLQSLAAYWEKIKNVPELETGAESESTPTQELAEPQM